MNILMAFVYGIGAGLIIGFLHGLKTGKKAFYKYPSAHWKIRAK